MPAGSLRRPARAHVRAWPDGGRPFLKREPPPRAHGTLLQSLVQKTLRTLLVQADLMPGHEEQLLLPRYRAAGAQQKSWNPFPYNPKLGKIPFHSEYAICKC